jgi:hypothetical protein
MTKRISAIMLGVGLLLAGTAVLLYRVTAEWTASYRESNATWTIRGLCTNSEDGTPVKGAEVSADFRETFTREHKWRDKTLKRTRVATTTGDEGRFELAGEGGSVYIKVQKDGYREPEPVEGWDCTSRNRTRHVETNVFFRLQPLLDPAPGRKRSHQ